MTGDQAADLDGIVGPCAMCGHDPACGFSQVNDEWLCHADDHSCYVPWSMHVASLVVSAVQEWADR